MTTKIYVLYLFLPLTTVVVARQDTNLNSASSVKDQDLANDKVTSILIQPGPAGPRHVILSDEHEIFSNYPPREELASGVASNYILSKASSLGGGYTAPPPRLVTYGPASQVTWHSRPRQQPQQLYHHRFAQEPTIRYQPVEKVPYSKLNKEESKAYPDAISKYASFTKHDKPKQPKSRLGGKGYTSRNYKNSDLSVTVPERGYNRPQYDDEGYDYQDNFHDDEEAKFRESIGEFEDVSKERDYSSEKKYRPHHSKQYSKQKNVHHENKYYSPVNNYQAYDPQYEEEPYHDHPSGFDDTNGGHVVPLVARFYKQPLPIIQTQLPVDNGGLYVQYVYPHAAAYDHEQVTNNYYDYPQRRSSRPASDGVVRNNYPSESEWVPINAPVGTVPARSYDIPAPDLSRVKDAQNKRASREPETSGVVVGKMKSPVSVNLKHHLSENSEGVVSAVVRVKQ